MSAEVCPARGCEKPRGHVGACGPLEQPDSEPLEPPVSTIPVSAREQIGRALDGALTPEQVQFLITEVLAITKRMWTECTCKACGQRQKIQVDVPDARAVTASLKDLLDQSFGRPAEIRAEAQALTVNRHVYVVEEAI